MSSASTFDTLAEAYDTSFVESLTGLAQRCISQKWLQPLLHGKTGLHILEINCGTGTDAMWLAQQGHHVTATDASAAMICKAQQKAAAAIQPDKPLFQTCAFDELHIAFGHKQFDCIFSNFAGLNCVPPHKLPLLARQFYALLRPGGYMAAVLFGKYCLWETVYYMLKANPQQAFRRWTKKEVMVPLTTATRQPVYYYTATGFARLLAPLKMEQKKPVGLFIPPSFLEALMQKHPRFFHWLVQQEENMHGPSFLSGLADHSFILLKKEVS